MSFTGRKVQFASWFTLRNRKVAVDLNNNGLALKAVNVALRWINMMNETPSHQYIGYQHEIIKLKRFVLLLYLAAQIPRCCRMKTNATLN